MNKLIKHRFKARLISFLMLVLPSIFLYIAAEAGSAPAVWVLMGIAVLGSVLALVVE